MVPGRYDVVNVVNDSVVLVVLTACWAGWRWHGASMEYEYVHCF
jgi:hypothetical protein